MSQQIYSSEAAKELGLGTSSLRKYAVELEAKGHHFARGTNNGRIFEQSDLTLISLMMEKITTMGLTIEQAAEKVLWENGNADEKMTHQDNDESIDTPANNELTQFIEQMRELEKQQAALTEMNKALVRQVENLTEKIEERERDQQLFNMIESSREKKKRRKGIALLGLIGR